MDLKPSNGAHVCTEKGFIIDGANGVGATKLVELQKFIPELKLDIMNYGMEGNGLLNDHVGADFVQNKNAFPQNFAYSNVQDQRLPYSSIASTLFQVNI